MGERERESGKSVPRAIPTEQRNRLSNFFFLHADLGLDERPRDILRFRSA